VGAVVCCAAGAVGGSVRDTTGRDLWQFREQPVEEAPPKSTFTTARTRRRSTST